MQLRARAGHGRCADGCGCGLSPCLFAAHPDHLAEQQRKDNHDGQPLTEGTQRHGEKISRRRAPRQRRATTRWLLRLLPNLIGIALLGWFFHGLNTQVFWAALRELQPRTVIGISVMTFLETATQGLLFFYLCPAGQSRWRHIWLSFAAQAGNVILPLRTGELLRPLYLKRWHAPSTYKELLGWTLVDKCLQVIAVLPFLLVGLYLFAADPQLSLVLRNAGLVFGGVLILLTVGFVGWMRRRVRQDLGAQAGVTPRAWLWATFWALVMWGASFGVYYFAVGDVKIALALLVVVGFGSGIPSLPAGVGAYEAAFLWVGERAHLPHDPVLALAVVTHVVHLLTTLAVGIPVLLWWGWPQRNEAAALGPSALLDAA